MHTKVSDSPKSLSKYKYSFNQSAFQQSVSSSLDNKPNIGQSKVIQTLPSKIKTGVKFELQKITSESPPSKKTFKSKKTDNYFKLPVLKQKQHNPQQLNKPVTYPHPYYQARVFKTHQSPARDHNYLNSLAKQHFIQCIQALRMGKRLKIGPPQKEIKLNKKNPKLKTVYLDMDQTLIHCDEGSNLYSVKLDFPIEGGGKISAGVRIRPYCSQFLEDLSNLCEVIIFTASSASYADIVLDHLDPTKKYFSHRLYRQHCTLSKQFYVKDLRVINRRLQDCLLVDNSAFSFMLQPENGVPILPFYHLAKDRELVSLLQFLKGALQYQDMRDAVKQTFFWHKYLAGDHEPRKILLNEFQKNN